ncbi:Serine/threonine-protein kinase pim-1 [Bagarius yarrelli]|uniref:non-specific serine/threonine protein kinase n=1 Tax=Bagarius yarrelli TaxID=175774 RepID=A0A556TR58_BAGYA|nr:Serine/threonine-protein kinase pim-1 [Bagarius yarrelli]
MAKKAQLSFLKVKAAFSPLGGKNQWSVVGPTSKNLDQSYETYIKETVHVGQNVILSCKYPESLMSYSKSLCKKFHTADWSNKESVEESKEDMNEGKFFLYDDRVKYVLNMTVKDVTEQDAGEYWCGAETSDHRYQVYFTHIDLGVTVSTVGFGLVLDMGFVETLKLLLWVVFIDCIGVGLLISTLMCSEMHKNDLILFIQRKSEECSLHADEPEPYLFWKIMELFCEENGEFKILYAYKLFEFGLPNQALDYCKTIASAVTTFTARIPITLLDQLIRLSEKLNKGKGNKPEWLLNLRLMHKKERDLLNCCAEREEHAEMPHHLKVANTPELYFSREREYRAFRYITEEITSQYIIGGLLGHGGGGVVYTGVRIADGREVAVKFAIRDEYQEMIVIPGKTTPIPVEVGLMQMVSKPFCDPNILELLEWFDIPGYMVLMLEKPSPCMNLTEFCKLYSGNLPEPLARDIMVQVVRAVRHCCDRGVFHNDIKPGNILINPQTLQIKLIDFGSGELFKETPYTFSPGTPGYFPPEWCRHKKYMGRPATVWTLGVILFQMLYGKLPFQSAKETVTGHLHFPSGVSEDCCDLISWCLAQDPESRPNFRQIFKHKWLMGGPSSIQINEDYENELNVFPLQAAQNTHLPNSVHEKMDSETNQSNSVYQSLNPNTKESDSVYQTLHPHTNQSDSVYQNVTPNTNQSYPVYQSLIPNTNQLDSVYQSLNPNNNLSGPGTY